MSCVLDRVWSRDRQSDTSLSCPGNHWEYSIVEDCLRSWTRWRAVEVLAVVSWSSSSDGWKLVRFNQPVANVLSPKASKHDSAGVSPSMISIQMHIIDARNSSRFMCAWPKRFLGNSSLQAFPLTK